MDCGRIPLGGRTHGITDGLTGAFNRRYLDTALAAELDRARQHGNALSIAMIDIDHYFKHFNDNHGHTFPSGVVQRVAVRSLPDGPLLVTGR